MRELLTSLTRQTYRHFEVLVIEDGSVHTCEDVVKSFAGLLDIRYYYKENSGQGFSRNYGFERATGDFFVILDSDALLPEHYFQTVEEQLTQRGLDAYGGPDREHPSFTPVQKAISYAMTSPVSTGGIRGGKKRLGGKFNPRSFNMGVSRRVYEKVGGFRITRMAEDLEYSIRIIRNGFKTDLIPEAFVYHKRRANLRQFYKQLHFFGRARINISRFYPEELKLVHWFPALFLLALLALPLLAVVFFPLFLVGIFFFSGYMAFILVDATNKNKSLYVGMLSVAAVIVQLTGYGVGFLTEAWQKWRTR